MASLARVINDMIIKALLDAQITSSAGDSPKINHVIVANQIREIDYESLDEALLEALEVASTEAKEGGEDSPSDLENVTKLFKGNTGKAKNLVDYVTNPEGKIMSLLTVAGPYGALVGAVIAAILNSEKIVDAIMDVITAPGSIADRRLKIFVQDGVNAFFSREAQRDKQIGLEHQVFTQIGGFGNYGGALTTNNLVEISKTGVALVDINMKSLGQLR